MPSTPAEFKFKIVKQTRQELVLESSPNAIGNVGCGIVISLIIATIFAYYAFGAILAILVLVTAIGFYIPILGIILGFFIGWGLILEPLKWLIRVAMTIYCTYPQKSICRFSQPLKTIALTQQTRVHTVTTEFSFDEVENVALYRYGGASAALYEIELEIKPQRSLQFTRIRLRLRPEFALIVGENDPSENFEADPSRPAPKPTVRILRPTGWKFFSSSPRCKWDYTPVPWWMSMVMGDRHPVPESSTTAPMMQRIVRQIKQLMAP